MLYGLKEQSIKIIGDFPDITQSNNICETELSNWKSLFARYAAWRGTNLYNTVRVLYSILYSAAPVYLKV
jgi:hypothetical protein